MNYTITEISNGTATVQFEDGAFLFVELSDALTEEDFDDMIFNVAPPQLRGGGTVPSWLVEGQQRTAVAKPEAEGTAMPDWLSARLRAYGDPNTQIEFITENGLDAWQTKVAEIKAANPKPSE